MAQIKLSIAFVLAAAAIAPIVAHPIREDHEFASNMGHRLHHHHNHHHHRHHHHHGVAIPEQSSPEPTSDTTPPPSRREYADESGDMFERAYSEHIASKYLYGPPGMGFGHGPVVHRPFNGLPSHGMGFGHGPVVHRPFNGFASPLLRSGRRLAGREVGAREFAEPDMFERDFEDVEFDARDFDEELHLD